VIPPPDAAPADSEKVPAPDTDTVMVVGAHPELSEYRTLNRIGVAVVPVAGLACPSDSAIW
jgi:hypothetical protein